MYRLKILQISIGQGVLHSAVLFQTEFFFKFDIRDVGSIKFIPPQTWLKGLFSTIFNRLSIPPSKQTLRALFTVTDNDNKNSYTTFTTRPTHTRSGIVDIALRIYAGRTRVVPKKSSFTPLILCFLPSKPQYCWANPRQIRHESGKYADAIMVRCAR